MTMLRKTWPLVCMIVLAACSRPPSPIHLTGDGSGAQSDGDAQGDTVTNSDGSVTKTNSDGTKTTTAKDGTVTTTSGGGMTMDNGATTGTDAATGSVPDRGAPLRRVMAIYPLGRHRPIGNGGYL